ncbi:uncharacterized protein BKA55DRAFT_653117 [Fusarium redolens]|uniref:PNPLA domain-containing protein n=1 Tax=Fusarium redolens TaxID=48865 RepID=A0A9P9G824_FUSRE|nr:uncharacterized protein BKA55DRAFT_653117 [Fusarium redolens]KAH7233918.1 hypothetical protein BKA55DRAFT_653117 [Fusarium redolens]
MPLPTSGKGLELLIIQICCSVIVYISACLRLWAQHVNRNRQLQHNNTAKKKQSPHDILMLASVLLYTVQTIVVIRGIIEGGIGQHASKIDIAEVTKGFQTWYFGELIYAVLSCLVKTSVILFLQEAYIGRRKIRKATDRRKICWILYICLAVIWATSIVFLSASIFQCSPPSHYWKQFENPSSEGACSKSVVPAAGIALSIVSAVSDWVLASVPTVALLKTQIPWQKKAAIQALSSLGVFRTSSSQGPPVTGNWTCRTHVERGLGPSEDLDDGEILVYPGQVSSSTHVGGQPDTPSKSGKYVAVYNAKIPTHMGNQKHAYKEDLDIVTAIIDVTRNWSRHQRFWDATDGRSSSLVYKYAMATTTVDDVLADNRWMTVSEQCGSLSIQLTPLLAERLDATQHTAGMALLIGSPTSGELSDHLKGTSSDGDILLNVDPRTKVLHVACPTLARHVGTEDHCPGDNIEWARVSNVRASQSLAAIYSRLLGPFTHVVCVFASSFTSTAELGTFLSTWLRSAWSGTQISNSSSASAHSMPHDLLVALPRLIVLTEEKSFPGSDVLENLKASLEAIVFEQTGFFLNRAFSSFTVKDTSTEACLLRQRRYTKLTALLASECAAARRTFERLNMLYHTHTMVDLFSRAYHCLLNNEVFNPVAASRAWSPVPPNAAQQIVRFLSEHKDEEALRTFALPYLISAIRANAYPAEAHPFDFPLIFDTLYKSIWHHAARTVCLKTDMYLLVENMVRDPVNTVVAVDNDGTTTHVRTVKSMSRLNSTNSQHTVTFVDSKSNDKGNDRQTQPKKVPTGRLCQEGDTVDLDTPMSSHERRHLLFLATSRDRWRSHKVHDYCPACILRRPEYGLPCGHMYCEYDIRRLGRKIGRETYAVEECTCCQACFTGVVFKFRPKTKGIRVLALDGGGVRGIIMLQCLHMLQSMLWVFLPGMPIIDLFDVCAGTSSGE